jgi:hypothetical protein
VAVVVALGTAVAAFISSFVLFSAYLSEATTVAPIETPAGITIQPPAVTAPMPPYLVTALIMCVLGSVVLAFIALALRRWRAGSVASTMFAVSAGPLAILLLEIVLTIFGYTQDPPAAHVGTVLGMRLKELAGWLLVYLVPTVVAWAVLLLSERNRRDRRDDESALDVAAPPPSA